jgi:hypothetical protein
MRRDLDKNSSELEVWHIIIFCVGYSIAVYQ